MNELSALQLGLEALKSGKIDEAIQYLEQAATATPDDPKALDLLGVAYAEKGLYSRAVGAFEAAIKLHPMSASLHYNLAQAYRADGVYEKAKEHYQQALKIDPLYLKAESAMKLIPSQQSTVESQSCTWHTEEQAIAKCSNCHLPICRQCQKLRDGLSYCPKCVEKLKL